MLKEGVIVEEKNGIGRVRALAGGARPRPWLGGLLSPMYDYLMIHSLFPNKFGSSYETHSKFLKDTLSDFHDTAILDLAAGSGCLSEALPPDNSYYGIDISEGLLKIAARKLKKSGMRACKLYSCPAEDLPFASEVFDAAVCNLSLNFFSSLNDAVAEARRVLKKGAPFFCSVPVPERNERGTRFQGRLLTEAQLRELFESQGLEFAPYELRNGVLLYFKATRRR